MKDEARLARNGELVRKYFAHLRELQEGGDGSVEELMSLWDPGGTLALAGRWTVRAVFRGTDAIRMLHRNRPRGRSASDGDTEDGWVRAALRPCLRRLEATDEGAVASWQTAVETSDSRAPAMKGVHRFTIEDGRIRKLDVTIAPEPEEVEGLSQADLTVDDIGRLSLAAWAAA